MKELEIIAENDELPNVHNLETKGKQILWILVFADLSKIEGGLSTSDIEYIAQRLKILIRVKDVSGLSISNLKQGFEHVDAEGKYHVTQRGINYIKEMKASNLGDKK